MIEKSHSKSYSDLACSATRENKSEGSHTIEEAWQTIDRPIQQISECPEGFGKSGTNDVSKHRKKDIKQKENFERRLQELPRPWPTFTDLPKQEWWRVFIDVPFHENAEVQSEPGKFFDNDRSPGYQQSMMGALETWLANSEKCHMNLDYDSYTALHKDASKHIRHKVFGGYQCEWMGKPNGISSDQAFTYTRLAPIPEEGPERQERLSALAEMRHEKINGLPLYVDYPHCDVEKKLWYKNMSKESTYDILEMSCDQGFFHLLNNAPNMKELLKELDLQEKPQGIVMGVSSSHDGTIGTIPLYSPEESQKLVDAILRVHNDRKKVNRTSYEIVIDTVKTVRNLYVLHPKYDGMRRTNVHLFLNKELIAQGLCPTMLPGGPNFFGGLKTLASLAKDVIEGMHLFAETVKKSRQLPQKDVVSDLSYHKQEQRDFDKRIERARTDAGKKIFESHTLMCLKEQEPKEQWLSSTPDQLAMVYHGMDIIKQYGHETKFQELFLINSWQFFKDSPFNEKYGVPTEDSAGKVFMQNHGLDFLKSDLGKKWLEGKDGQEWADSYSGKMFKKRHKMNEQT